MDHNRMTDAPVRRMVITLGLPSVVSMMITTIYNMADTWFVSHLGTQATAAVGISFAIMEMINSIGFLFGTGAGTRIGILLGAKKQEDAARVGSSAFCCTALLSLLISALGLLFLSPLMRLLGSSETILPFARDYGQVMLIGFPIMALSIMLSTFLRCEGRNRFSMIGIGLGGILNLLLDPLFIFALGLGIRGAALATLVSQIVSFALLLFFFLSGRTETKLRLSSISFSPRLIADILIMGTPSLCRHGVGVLYSIVQNTAAGLFGGDVLIAALAIVSKVAAIVLALLKGLSQGAQSLYSYNHGAGRGDRVREAFRFSFSTNTLLIVLIAFLGWFAAPGILSLFSVSEPAVVQLGIQGLRFYLIGLIFMPFGFAVNVLLQAIDRPWPSTFLASLPQGLFYVPCAFLLPRFWGITGLMLAPLLAYFLTDLVTLPYAREWLR